MISLLSITTRVYSEICRYVKFLHKKTISPNYFSSFLFFFSENYFSSWDLGHGGFHNLIYIYIERERERERETCYKAAKIRQPSVGQILKNNNNIIFFFFLENARGSLHRFFRHSLNLT
jgi:hypothetical protein